MGGPVRQVPPPHKEGLTHGDTPRQGAEAWILPPCGASAGGGDAGTQKDGALVATAGAWLSRGSRPSLSGSRIYVRLPWNGCACRRRPGGTLMALLQSGGRYPCKNQSIWRTQKGRFQKKPSPLGDPFSGKWTALAVSWEGRWPQKNTAPRTMPTGTVSHSKRPEKGPSGG